MTLLSWGLPSLKCQTVYTPYTFSLLAGSTPGSADGTGSAALFNGISALSLDSNGTLYVADDGNHTVRKVTPEGIVTTLAGSPGIAGSSDGTGSAASFNEINSIAVDQSGNVYVGDTYSVRKISPAGVTSTLAGGPVAGGSDGVGSSAQFGFIRGLAVDPSGNVLVADSGTASGGAIRKVSPSGTVTTLAGMSGQAGDVDGTGTAARFGPLYCLAMDQSGNLYTLDIVTYTIRRITPGGIVTTVAGKRGIALSADGTGSNATFGPLGGMSADANGNLYVTDSSPGTVRRITSAEVATTLGGFPNDFVLSEGTGPNALFEYPTGIAATPSGTVYVADGPRISVGTPASLLPATVTLGNLNPTYNGMPQPVTVTTSPAGLATVVSYYPTTGTPYAPSGIGSYGVTAAITDPNYTGSAYGVLTISPVGSTQISAVQALPSSSVSLRGIAQGQVLVAVGTGGTVVTSPDGTAWTQRTSGTAQNLNAIGYGAGAYVAVGDAGTILRSTDGVLWTKSPQTSMSANLTGVVYGNSLWIAVGNDGSIVTSPDGSSWTADTPWTSPLTAVAYVPGYNYTYGPAKEPATVSPEFFAVGDAGVVITSTDGVNWTSLASTADVFGYGDFIWDLSAVTSSAPGQALAVGPGGAAVFTYWARPLGTSGSFFPNTQFASGFEFASPVNLNAVVGNIAAGDGGAVLLNAAPSTSFDPLWCETPSGTTANLRGGTQGNNATYFVGDQATVVTVGPTIAPNFGGSRLANLSCRAGAGTGASTLIAGFVVGGSDVSGSVPLLVRASGPSLTSFGVTGILPDPKLQLYTGGQPPTVIASDSGWAGSSAISSVAAAVGAFAWTVPTSLYSALTESLAPGAYTANVSGASGDSGVALVEVYDATPASSVGPSAPRLINISARAQVGTGSDVLIAGFVIEGTAQETVLIRASGPALKAFGVTGVLPDPTLTVTPSGGGPPLQTPDGMGVRRSCRRHLRSGPSAGEARPPRILRFWSPWDPVPTRRKFQVPVVTQVWL